MSTLSVFAAASLAFMASGAVFAQDEGNVADHFRDAYAAAGTDHYNLFNMICPRIENSSAGKIATPENARSESIERAIPMQVFDNLYYVGEYSFWESSASAWVVDTGEGLVLIDALYPDSGHLIESGLETLGLDPKDIKYIVIGHGHADHYGAARELQDKYGAEVLMAEPEWEFMSNGRGEPDTKPVKDQVIEDGQELTLGNTTFRFYITPGHTPGTVSTIFNVQGDDGEHVVAQWGGTGFGFGGAEGDEKIEWFRTYAASAERFESLVRDQGADVMIANHPGLDNTYEKHALSETSSSNPWVIGVEKVANYIQTAQSCALAGVAAYK
ncbi:MBL fold metallo-hydrolase [Devosia sp. 1566]|uniref:MBL fold metallo-hydrolase n=1 Tax=Devosia sp. 1566 TaxID=2499144 RepID=UPI0020C0D065|nr:MBL fold metallo-hydrolase [Devosia sp. 1566]